MLQTVNKVTAIPHVIAGWSPAEGASSDVFNPATGELTGRVATATTADVGAAVSAARAAFPGWAATSPHVRARVMFRLRDLMERRLDDRPLVHCHAVIRTRAGAVRGGHILADRCVVGGAPISVLVTSIDDFELRQRFDPKTNIALLQPHESRDHD